MRDVIYVKLDIVYSINQQLNETITRKSYFWNSEIESKRPSLVWVVDRKKNKQKKT